MNNELQISELEGMEEISIFDERTGVELITRGKIIKCEAIDEDTQFVDLYLETGYSVRLHFAKSAKKKEE